MKCNLQLLSKYRTQLMGIAILLVVLVHTPFDDSNLIFPLRLLHRMGYGGVDFFFLLSGLGIYFAYQKESIKTFYKRRFMRILPYYLPIVLLFSIFFLYRNGLIEIGGIFTRFFLVDYWLNSSGGLGWYIPTALLFYLLTPLIMKIVDFKNYKSVILAILILYVFSIFVNEILTLDNQSHDTQRLAVYVLGIYIGYLISNNKSISIGWLITSFIIGCVLLGLNYTNYPYGNYIFAVYLRVIPFFFLVLPICVFLSSLMSCLPNYKYTILNLLGTYTLCIYIFHERISLIVFYYIGYGYFSILIIITTTLIIAVLWQEFITSILKKTKLL